MEKLKAFWDVFGYSFITLAVVGVVIAFFIEISVKKLYESMIAKTSDEAKKEKLKDRKSKLSVIVAVILSAFFGASVVVAMPFPAGKLLILCWVFVVYIVQYLCSLYIFPSVIESLKNSGKKEKKVKPKTVRVIKNADGTYTEI